MKIINIHRRVINQPKDRVTDLFSTLATKDDKIWPIEHWPPMRFKDGLKPGAEGGHGPIGYTVQQYKPSELIEFRFTRPRGFAGIHRLEMLERDKDRTELVHTIDMETSGLGTLSWHLAIRWLHDALIEDAFDKIENKSPGVNKKTKWNAWVKILRTLLQPAKRNAKRSEQ